MDKATSKVEEAIGVARAILAALDKGQSVTAALRQCERLANLLEDPFMTAYATRALQPSMSEEQRKADLQLIRKRHDAEASGIFQFYSDFQTSGDPVSVQLKRLSDISFGSLRQSVPEAETFATTARKSIKYRLTERDFTKNVEIAEAVLERVRNRVYRWASAILSRLLFESIPEQVMDATRRRVDSALATMCPRAIEKFAVAYEELRGASAENWTNACLGVRRILLDLADAVYPARDGLVDGHEVGREQYVSRLWAYAKAKLDSKTGQGLFTAELTDLGNRLDKIYDLSNKGIHDVVRKDEADRVVVRAYLLIADLL